MVMPANNAKAVVHYWAGRYPGLLGHLYSPGDRRAYDWLPFALDNGAFAAWTTGQPWDADAFRRHVEFYAKRKPLWVVVPDVVADRQRTIDRWYEWAPQLATYGIPLAFAVQDGMTPPDVPVGADVVFVGGGTYWKRRTLHLWPQQFDHVHVGRVNTEKWLWRCVEAGVESCDGTGWFRGDQRQYRGLERFLARYAAGHRHPEHRNFTLFEGVA